MRNLILAITTLTSFSANAMQFHAIPIDNNVIGITATGEIVSGDTARFMTLIEHLAADTPTRIVGPLMLDSPGGQLLEAEKLAHVIRRAKIAVAVSPNHQCVSACFLLFAAGSPRAVAPDALIGVHSASEAGGKEDYLSMALTTMMARAAAGLDVPAQIVAKIVTTPANQMAWLTRDDLALMHVLIVKPHTHTPP